MKIAVDGYELGKEARGVGRAVRNILVHLPDFLPDDTFLLFTKEAVGRSPHPRVSELVLPGRGGYVRWQNGALRRALRQTQPDIFIASNYLLPLFHPRKSVLFEHDISVVAHPEWYLRKYALTRKFLIGRSLRRAKLIIVPSEFTKQEITKHFDLEPEKTAVLVYGVEESFRRPPEEDVLAWKARQGLAGRQIVGFLGSFFSRRHIPVLVGAVDLLRRESPEAMLYLVGKDYLGLSEQEMARIFQREGVKWVPDLPEQELPLYYAALDVFAYLSEYEGFGFPPLEALSCGTPVVLLRSSSLREVFEGMAFMVDRPDEEEVARALRLALSDEEGRRRHRGRFEQRRPEFAWPEIARQFSLLIQGLKTRDED